MVRHDNAGAQLVKKSLALADLDGFGDEVRDRALFEQPRTGEVAIQSSICRDEWTAWRRYALGASGLFRLVCGIRTLGNGSRNRLPHLDSTTVLARYLPSFCRYLHLHMRTARAATVHSVDDPKSG